MKFLCFLLFTALAAFFFTGQFSGCMEPPTPPSSIAPLDSGNKVAVKSAINPDPDLASQQIEVTVWNKEATLTGTVASEEQKKKAEELAGKSSGITKVINKLEVKKQD
jgi:hypothetical protein